jgi:hypothetical protein
MKLIERARSAGKMLVASNKSDLARQAQMPDALPVSHSPARDQARRAIIEGSHRMAGWNKTADSSPASP